jgi:5'-3' exonuclease
MDDEKLWVLDMAILLDFNQVMLASFFANTGGHATENDIDESMIRHMFLNSLRYNRKKFSDEWGELIICCDNRNVWRKDIFPYYKANRKKTRNESDIDWNRLFVVIHKIRDEIDQQFPYKVINVDRCEADDIIGTIVHEKGTALNTGGEKFLILSGDKDYIQLHTYANVGQYDPVHKRWIRNDNPVRYLQEQILKGDAGDGVPNILSPDNCLAVGERQRPMTSKKLYAFLDQGEAGMTEEVLSAFHRNRMMIDLKEVPQIYKDEILEKYYETKEVGREHLFNYFVKNKLKNLISDIQDF